MSEGGSLSSPPGTSRQPTAQRQPRHGSTGDEDPPEPADRRGEVRGRRIPARVSCPRIDVGCGADGRRTLRRLFPQHEDAHPLWSGVSLGGQMSGRDPAAHGGGRDAQSPSGISDGDAVYLSDGTPPSEPRCRASVALVPRCRTLPRGAPACHPRIGVPRHGRDGQACPDRRHLTPLIGRLDHRAPGSSREGDTGASRDVVRRPCERDGTVTCDAAHEAATGACAPILDTSATG